MLFSYDSGPIEIPGFSVTHTGGGNFALERYTPDGGYWYVTDDGRVPELDKGDEIGICRYRATGDPVHGEPEWWTTETDLHGALSSMLAYEFGRVLRQWLTLDEMETVRARNRAEWSPGVCHSHDFCDANMAMDEAFHDLYGVHPIELPEGTAIDIWNAAWDKAVEWEFKAGKT